MFARESRSWFNACLWLLANGATSFGLEGVSVTWDLYNINTIRAGWTDVKKLAVGFQPSHERWLKCIGCHKHCRLKRERNACERSKTRKRPARVCAHFHERKMQHDESELVKRAQNTRQLVYFLIVMLRQQSICISVFIFDYCRVLTFVFGWWLLSSIG